jgi:hypothetical protein
MTMRYHDGFANFTASGAGTISHLSLRRLSAIELMGVRPQATSPDVERALSMAFAPGTGWVSPSGAFQPVLISAPNSSP